MAASIINFCAVVLVIYNYYKSKNNVNRINKFSIRVILITITCLTIITLSLLFTELIRTHNETGHGIDILGYYMQSYGILIFTVLGIWILFKTTNRFETRQPFIISLISFFFLFFVIYFLLTNHPKCDMDYDMCSKSETFLGGMMILILLFLILCIEIIYILPNRKLK